MKQLRQYIQETLGTGMHPVPIPKRRLGRLPFYIGEIFKLYESTLFNQELLLVEYRHLNDFSILRTEKDFDLLKQAIPKKVVLVIKELTFLNRKRLIEKGINFIVPGKQLFLPEMLLDLRETFTSPRANRRIEKLLPSAQFLLLFYILHRNTAIEKYSFKELAEVLNYTQMAITKAVENLKHHELITVEGRKEKQIRFSMNRIELWNDIEQRKLFVNPVLKIVYVDEKPREPYLLACGESALPEFTDMNPSRQKNYAIEKSVFYSLLKNNALLNVNDYEGEYCMEVWKYDPNRLADKLDYDMPVVDPLSLYLSLKDSIDERIEMALEQIIEKSIW